MLRGAITAAVTPLADGGRRLDEQAFGPLVRFLAGRHRRPPRVRNDRRGVLLTIDERRRAAERFLETRPDGFLVAVHAGAQSTADTVELATHAKEIGADAVAVIAPPYFPLDAAAVLDHLRAAAEAYAPLPFYVYEFAARSGYAIPVGRSNACARRRRTSPA